MKKLIYCAAALATALFAGSCQQELLETTGSETTVTYSVELPGAVTKAGETDSKIGDGSNVTELIYELWLVGDDAAITSSSTRLFHKTTPMLKRESDGKRHASVTLNLVQDQKYRVLFWAQVGGKEIYVTDNLTSVTYKKDLAKGYQANQEDYAAFYATEVISTVTPPKSKTIELKRPFAQINIGTENTLQSQDGYTIDMNNSYVQVRGIPTTFNVATSVTSDPTATITFNEFKVPSETLTVDQKPYEYVAMNYVFASAKGIAATVEYNIYATLKPTATGSSNVDVTVNNTIDSVPLKENYRTNIVGNLLSSSTQYEIVVDAEFNEPSDDVYVTEVASSEELQAALHQNMEHIVIDLASVETKAAETAEYKLNIGANETEYYFGGENTKTITINANGNKINFVHNNSGWDHIRCVNDQTKWIINDATLTNSKNNSGTAWDKHNICFYNAVELNNVISDKAIALQMDSKLTNVKIEESVKAYGLWLTATGQKVEINGLEIKSLNGGRGIAIKDEYVKEPALVTLNIKNAKFTTAKKAAVVISSVAGATINWGEGNNIQAVAADPVNPVWVDKRWAEYFDLVTVNGGTKVLEGAMKSVLVYNSEELQNAVNNAVAGVNEIGFGADITGNVTIPQNDKINIIINGLGKKYDGTITIDGNSRHTGAETLVIKNVNFEHSGSGLYFIEQNDAAAEAVRYPHNVTVEDCTFKGDGTNVICGVRYRQGYNIAVKNCTAEGLFLFMWTTGCSNITVDNVDVIDSYKEGGFSLGVKDQITVKNSKVVASDPYGYGVRIDGDANGTWNIADNDFTAEAPVIVRKSKTAHTLNLSGNTLTTTKDYQVIVCANEYKAGQELVEPSVKYVATGTDGLTTFPIRIIHEPSGLIWDGSNAKKFWVKNAEQLRNAVSYFNGQTHSNEGNIVTLELEADIDLAGQAWTPWNVMFITLNGNNHTISNVSNSFFGYAGAVKVNDLTLKNVTAYGHQAGTFAAQAEGSTFTNCVLDGTNTVTYVNEEKDANGVGAVTGLAINANLNVVIAEGATVVLDMNTIENTEKTTFENFHNGYKYTTYSTNAGTIVNNGTLKVVAESEIVAKGQGTTYSGDRIDNKTGNNYFVLENSTLTGNAKITFERAYAAVILGDLKVDVDGDFIVSDKKHAIFIDNCDITLQAGQKLIMNPSDEVKLEQIFINKVTINGKEMRTMDDVAPYLDIDRITWYGVSWLD